MIYNGNRTKWGPIRSVIIRVTRELAQQDGGKTQDGRMTKKRGARLCIPNLTRHSAVLSVPAFLLRKLPTNKIGRPFLVKAFNTKY